MGRHIHAIYSVNFSPDGKKIITGSQDHTARIWDVESGEELLSIKHPAEVLMVAFSPDGRRVITACQDGIVRLFVVELENI